MFLQKIHNCILWRCLTEQVLNEMFINFLVFVWLQFSDLGGNFIQFSLPVGNAVVVADDADLNVCCLFDLKQISDVAFIEKGDIGAFLTSPARSARTVDVRLRIFWRGKLYDQLNIRNVDASRCHISGHKDLLVPISEIAHIDLPRSLGNVPVEDDDVLAFELADEIVGLRFGLREDDGAIVGIVL